MADIAELIDKAKELFENNKEEYLMLNEDIRLLLLRQEQPSPLIPTFYEPALCLILQGRKEVIAGNRNLSFGDGELLIISHDIPVVSKITDASRSQPYIALVLQLDYAIIRALHDDFSDTINGEAEAKSLEVISATPHISDSLYRLIDVTQSQTDTKVLLPQILREVHFRLMQLPCGKLLRDLLHYNSHATKISKAISLIREQYRQTLSMPDIAKSVGMSVSSFFHHFKAITESTPLQYQKDVRLLEARRMLVSEGESVTLTALSVGYESPNQFSREYVRKFGVSPSGDLRAATTQQ